MKNGRIIIGLIGRKGSGKGETTKLLIKNGFEAVEMGAILYSIAKEKGIDINHETIKRFMIDIRAERGENVIAEETLKKVNSSRSMKLVIVGIRSPSELYYFKKHLNNFKTIAVTADDETRFKRMKARGAPEDPESYVDFMDYKNGPEAKVRIEDIINDADYRISNAGTLEDLSNDMEYVLSLIGK